MASEERALKFLTMTDSDERVIQLTRLLDQHAAEEIAKRKCENCTYFKYDDECHVPSSDEEDALGEKLPIWSASVLPEYCCPQFKEKEDE